MQANNLNPIEPTNRSHRILVLSFTILLTAGAIGGGTYYVLDQQIKKQDKLIIELQKETASNAATEKAEEKKTEIPAVKDETADWKRYTSTKYNMSFKYPTGWTVSEDYRPVSAPYSVIDSENNIVINNDLEKKAIVFNLGEIGGRGGLCVKYIVTYKTNLANDKLNIVKISDKTITPALEENAMCSSLKGYEPTIDQFKFNTTNIWIRTDSVDEQSVETDKVLFEKIADTVVLIDK